MLPDRLILIRLPELYIGQGKVELLTELQEAKTVVDTFPRTMTTEGVPCGMVTSYPSIEITYVHNLIVLVEISQNIPEIRVKTVKVHARANKS